MKRLFLLTTVCLFSFLLTGCNEYTNSNELEIEEEKYVRPEGIKKFDSYLTSVRSDYSVFVTTTTGMVTDEQTIIVNDNVRQVLGDKEFEITDDEMYLYFSLDDSKYTRKAYLESKIDIGLDIRIVNIEDFNYDIDLEEYILKDEMTDSYGVNSLNVSYDKHVGEYMFTINEANVLIYEFFNKDEEVLIEIPDEYDIYLYNRELLEELFLREDATYSVWDYAITDLYNTGYINEHRLGYAHHVDKHEIYPDGASVVRSWTKERYYQFAFFEYSSGVNNFITILHNSNYPASPFKNNSYNLNMFLHTEVNDLYILEKSYYEDGLYLYQVDGKTLYYTFELTDGKISSFVISSMKNYELDNSKGYDSDEVCYYYCGFGSDETVSQFDYQYNIWKNEI